MSARDRQDVDTSVGRGQPGAGADVGPTSGKGGGQSTDEAIGLGGADDREGTGGDFGTGLETGNAARGSSYNSATRPDTLNTPGERDGGEARPDDRDELRGRRT